MSDLVPVWIRSRLAAGLTTAETVDQFRNWFHRPELPGGDVLYRLD